MRSRTALAALAAALVLPAAAAGADTFVIVSEPEAPQQATQVLATLPSALEANQPGQIAVDADFATHPAWVEQRSPDDLRNLWERAGNAYGIPWQVLGAINKVESNFGSNMGPSSAGAVGWMQFMPDTWLSWGMDANGDGVADPWNADDAIYSAARYLAASGGANDISRALFSYNHADWYVNEVLSLATVYAGGNIDVSALGSVMPDVDIAAAAEKVSSLEAQLAQAEEVAATFGRSTGRATSRVRRTELLSDRLLAQKRLTIAGVRFTRAQAAVQRLRTRLAKARNELELARAGAFASPVQLVGAFQSSAIGTGLLAPFSFEGPTVAGAPGVALRYALSKLGTPYVWGAEGPYAFDCSGLTQAAYLAAGVILPRVAQQQFDAGPWVPAGEALQPGDLVFFGNGPDDVSHMGMVAGPGLMINAPHSGAVVRFDSYDRASFVGATRPAANLPVTAAPGEVLEFSTGAPESGSPAVGEILFTKNP